jgi:hypothetical protein
MARIEAELTINFVVFAQLMSTDGTHVPIHSNPFRGDSLSIFTHSWRFTFAKVAPSWKTFLPEVMGMLTCGL